MLAFLRTLLAVIIGIFLSFFLIFIFFMAIAASFGHKEMPVAKNSVLVLTLDNVIPERPINNPFKKFSAFSDDLKSTVSLKEIVDNIRYAKTDDNIKGIYLETGMVQASYPTVGAIRDALKDFKKSGKWVYAYSETYTNKNYYLSSVADSVYLNPTGVIAFNGFSSQQVFIRGMLDKLGVEPNLIRAGKYKSAGEMFTRKDLSDPNRQQLQDYLNSVYGQFLQDISESRKISPADLRNIADQLLVRFPSDAKKYRLVDRLAYKDQVLATMKKNTGIDGKKDLATIEMDKYADAGHSMPHTSGGSGHIALIYAVGDISGGEGSETAIGSEGLSKAIRKARLDDNVKAIVLRVNSPGGGALASDIIWREVVLAKQVKPVIASFSDLAASGGYYIAAPCSYIFCEPTTITGSIGVFALIPNAQQFFNDKLGITFDEVKTGKYAALDAITRPLTPDEQLILQNYIDTTYHDFKMRVSEGRHLNPAFVDSIAQGHIYSGLQAKQLGLVDQIGSLDDAIEYAAKKANLSNYSIRILPEYRNFKLSMLLGSMAMSKEEILKQELKENYSVYKRIEEIQKMKGVLMYYPFEEILN
jgi:protease-4